MKGRLIAGLIALVVAGVALFFVLGRRHAGGPGTAQKVQPAVAATSGGGREGGAPQGPPDVLADDDRAGRLRLEGQVVDSEDRPVAGAIVTLSAAPPRQVRSEADGSFVFDKLIGRGYTLTARADEGTAGPVMTRLTARSEPVILRLRPAAVVEVTVVDARGRTPIAGAQVELRGLDTLTATTGADGKATLKGVAVGNWALAAWAPGRGKSFANLRIPRFAAVVEKRTIELRAGAAVTGRVVSPDGKPVAQAQVSYEGLADRSQRPDPRRDAVATDANGAFRFDALPAGTFRFVARDDSDAPGASTPVTLDGQNDRGDVQITLEPGALLAGRVVSKEGEPVPGASVRVVVRTQGFGGGRNVRVTATDEKGGFELKALPRKTIELVAEAEQGTSEVVSADLALTAEKRDVELVLDVDGAIAGVVVDTQGKPVPDAQVSALPDVLGQGRGARRGAARNEMMVRGLPAAMTDSAGRFELRGLAPGDYMLHASWSQDVRAAFGRAMRSDGTAAKTGDRDVKITLARDGGVKGRVALSDGSPVTGTFVVNVTGGGGGAPFDATDGSFELDEIPPGTVGLNITGSSFERTSLQGVKIEADKVTDVGTITVVRGRTISGHVVDGSGAPVPGASVYAARRLFGDGSRPAGGPGGFGAGGGPGGGGGNNRTVTSDDQGLYVIAGVGPQDMVLMAESEAQGRSRTLLIPGSQESATADLQLLPFAALAGKVTQNGQGLDGITVSAASQTVPSATFNVQTGQDGTFRFDRLAPDTYRVSAMAGRNPIRGITFHSQVVTLAPGQTGDVSIDVVAGSVELDVTATAEAGVNLAMVFAATSHLAAKTAKDLLAQVGRLPPGTSFTGVAIRGNPAKVTSVIPGAYSVCAVPFPNELQGLGAIRDYLDREGENLPVFCVDKTVGPDAVQAVAIPVVVPPFVPPPAPPSP